MVRNALPDPYRQLEHKDWWHPETLSSESPLLNEQQLSQFRENGFIVLTGLWPDAVIEQASKEAAILHPYESVIESHQAFTQMPFFEAKGSNDNRGPKAAANQMTIHPRALALVAQLMNTEEMNLRLSQSHIIAKYGAQIDKPGDPNHGHIVGDQEIHVDYGNNTLLVPPHTSSPEAIACLCYYSDVDECGGATHFAKALPGELTTYESERFNPPGFNAVNGSLDYPSPRSKQNIDRLYETEKPVCYKPGTCILYGLNAWHRGTPVAIGKVRYTHHHVWRHRNAEWVNWQSLAPKMYGMPTCFLEQLTVLQRTVLGFAAPGNAYWTEETIDAVGQRYPGMDMTPYKKAQKS